MTHLVANYPDTKTFSEALVVMLQWEVQYIEIQLPFTNPVADGPMIYEANQKALRHTSSLEEICSSVHTVTTSLGKIKSKILLMSYLTPLAALSLRRAVDIVARAGLHGFIIPDLPPEAPEYQEFSKYCRADNLCLVPVLSPYTVSSRIELLKGYLQPRQLVYATARAGQTGTATNIMDQGLQAYLRMLPQELAGHEIAVGFGIRTKEQINFLQKQGLLPVIGSEIVRQIQTAVQNKQDVAQTISNFLTSLQL